AGRFAPSGSAATLTWALFAFASPLVVFSSQIYPEVPGALLSTGAALSFEKYRDEGSRVYLWLTGCMLAALPWLNVRQWFVVGAMGLVALFRGSTSLRQRTLDSVPLVLPLLLATIVHAMIGLKVYGVPIPNAGAFIKNGGEGPQLRLSDSIDGFLGLFFDRARGLLANSPVYFIVFAGVAAAVARGRGLTSLLFAGAVGGVAAASNRFWGGGWCPPSRYMLISAALTVPLAAPALLDRRLRLAWLALGVWSFFVAAAYSAFPLMRYTPGDARSGELGRSLQAVWGIDPMWIFPALVRPRLVDFL